MYMYSVYTCLIYVWYMYIVCIHIICGGWSYNVGGLSGHNYDWIINIYVYKAKKRRSDIVYKNEICMYVSVYVW